jgi:chemotaxis protein methyltransferase CheR
LKVTDIEFFRIVNYIRTNLGINLSNKRALVEKRLEDIVLDNKFENITELMNVVENDSSKNIANILMGAVVTNHTFFMREELHFELLKNVILPKLLKKDKEENNLRIWSAATSTGQEAYSIAMILKDFIEEEDVVCSLEIIGTDIIDNMLKIAENGEYTKEEMGFVSAEWKSKYFTKKINGCYKINEYIKKDIQFKKLNLITQFKFEKKYHIIFLRNILIYFESGLVNQVVEKVVENLMIGGYLFIGMTEIIEINSNKLVNVQPSVYRRI